MLSLVLREITMEDSQNLFTRTTPDPVVSNVYISILEAEACDHVWGLLAERDQLV